MSILVIVIYCCAILITVMVMSKLTLNAQHPLIAADALDYSNGALQFAEQRSISVLPDFQGKLDNDGPFSTHTFIFEAFLSQALLFTEDHLGYPNDQALRMAFQLTFFYMLLSLVALASNSSRFVGAGALSILFLLQVPELGYISSASSRDAFRIIPLMLLATVLCSLSPKRLKKKIPILTFMIVFFLALLAFAAHTLNLLMLGIVIGAWLCWQALNKIYPWKNIFLVLASAVLGTSVVSLHYLKSYFDTGSWLGYDNYFHMFKGTPMWNAMFEKGGRFHNIVNLTSVERLKAFLVRDHYHLSVEALLSSMISVGAGLICFAKKRKYQSRIFFLSSIILLGLIPHTGLLDFTKPKLSDWLIANLRYALPWYPFAAACASVYLLALYHKTSNFSKSYLWKLHVAAIFIISVCWISLIDYKDINSSWRVVSSDMAKNILSKMQEAADVIPADQKFYYGGTRYFYYYRHRMVSLYRHPALAITRSKTQSELNSLLNNSRIKYVILAEPTIHKWWDQSPLFVLLNKKTNAKLMIRNDFFRTYKIFNEQERQQFLVQKAQLKERNNLLSKQLLSRIKEDILVKLEPFEIGHNKQGNNKEFWLKADAQIVAEKGPCPESLAVALDNNSGLMGPAASLSLKSGSLSMWARLKTGGKKYSYLVRVNRRNDLLIYRQDKDGRFWVKYDGVSLGLTSRAIKDNDWHYYVFTWKKGVQNFYIDGHLEVSSSKPASFASVDFISLGWPFTSNSYQWNGSLADFTTYKRALTDNEVMILYSHEKSCP